MQGILNILHEPRLNYDKVEDFYTEIFKCLFLFIVLENRYVYVT